MVIPRFINETPGEQGKVFKMPSSPDVERIAHRICRKILEHQDYREGMISISLVIYIVQQVVLRYFFNL